MANRDNKPRRVVGNLLIVAGLLLLLGVVAYLGWTELRAAQVRAALAQNPPVIAAVAEATATPIPPTAAPTRVPPTLTPTRPPTATALPPSPTTQAATAAAPVAAPTEVPPSPTAVKPTAVPPTPRPVATPVPPVSGTGSPVRLVFADLKLDAKVVPMGWEVVQTAAGPRSEWVIPKNEAGHHINSALLGQNDNLVISGHNNIFGMVFRPISLAWDNDKRIPVDSFTDRSEILNGRIIALYDAAGMEYRYVVTDFLRLKDTGVPAAQRLANARFMQPTGEAQLTLITCWPPTNNTHRLVVIAKPAP